MTALQTVPRAMVLAEGATRASDRTVVEAVDALAGHAARTPRVVGPPPLCERFLPRWSDATGAVPALFQRHHLYRLESVTPGPDVPGVLQRAVAADGPLASVWAQRFLVDVGDAPEDAPAPDLTPLLARGRLHLWRAHDAPVAMAAWTRPTRGGCAIAYVYTPPEERGRGYATALVRELSRGLLEGALGLSPRTFVCLYANAAQPAPNRVYAAVGYRPVGASEVWRLDAP